MSDDARLALLDEDAAEASEGEEEEHGGGEAAGGEGERGEGEGGSSDSSDEEEDNDYDRTDGFLVDEAEESDEAAGDEEGQVRKKKKKRKREREPQLDEEDYELLAEAGIHRPKPQERRRIRKKQDVDVAGGRRTAADIERELFGVEDDGLEDELEEPGTAARTATREEEYPRDDAELLSEDDDAWIVHEDGEGGERRRPRRASGVPQGVSSRAYEEAMDIFGNADALLQQYQASKASRLAELGGGGEEDEVDELDMSDEEAAEQLRVEKEERRRRRMDHKVTASIDPELMKRHHLLPVDQEIRDADLPEREQLAARAAPLEQPDHAACAVWIYDRLFRTWTVPAKKPEQPGEMEKVSRFEAELVVDGVMEVEGPPIDGRPKYRGSQRERERDGDRGRGELYGGMDELGSRRGVRRLRTIGQASRWRADEAAQQRIKDQIQQVLVHLWDKHEEVPLVAMYRKEVAGELLAMREEDMPERTRAGETDERRAQGRPDFPVGTVQAQHRRMRRWEVLWAVQSYSVRWRQLQKRREQRRRLFRAALEACGSDEERDALLSCLDALDEAQTAEALDDVDVKFRLAQQLASSPEAQLQQLALSADGGALPGGGRRRPVKTTLYSLTRRAGLGPLAASLGLAPGQLADNLEVGYKRHETQDPRVTPEAAAAAYVTDVGGFATPEAVLEGMRAMAGAELAAHPGVRRFVRELYEQLATVTTEPTAAGEAQLDAFHALGPVKRLRNKPAATFMRDDSDAFLRLQLAEQQGLITASVGVPPEVVESEVMSRVAEGYLSEGVSDVSNAWNEQRRQVLSDVVQRQLLPVLQRELRVRLLADAHESLLRAASEKLWSLAIQAPLRLFLPDDDNSMLPEPRIMACCWGPGKPATTFVMLDSAGQMTDLLPCAQLSGPLRRPTQRDGTYTMFDDPRKSKDAARVREFLMAHRPHVVVVGGGCADARQLKADVERIRDYILEYHPQLIVEMETGNIDVRFADETLAAAWESSNAAAEELPDATATVRRAVGLGRALLDPLAVLTSLCGPGREVLALQLHPLQGSVPDEERLAMVERTLITAVAQVGVDVNAMARTPWLAAPLQFVPGLGPRKAAALLKAVQRERGVEAREDIWQQLGCVGKLVFKNCAAFMKVYGSNYENELDGTRVHPRSYETARQLAIEAVGAGRNPVIAAMDGKNRWAVEKLDLVEFDARTAAAAEAAGQPARRQLPTLVDITFELLQPYGDFREEARPLKEEDVFWMLTGESPATLLKGRRVEAVVRWVGAEDARCSVTELAGVDAMLPVDLISSTRQIADARDVLHIGDVLTARVHEVQAREFRIVLTTRADDLNQSRRWEAEYLASADPFFHVPTQEEEAAAALARKKESKTKQYLTRPIKHPYFKNCTLGEATNELKEAEVGECLFLPTKSSKELRLCIKIYASEQYGHQFQNLTIKEGAKGSSANSVLRLGRPLEIDFRPLLAAGVSEKYEDLDEIYARFVEPYAERLREVQGHRKWRAGDKESVRAALKEERQRNPNQAVYCLSIDMEPQRTGYFCLTYILRNNPATERFNASPNGFYWRSRIFPSIDAMLAHWKRHPVPPAAKAAAAAAAPSRAGYGHAAVATPGRSHATPGRGPYAGAAGMPVVGPFGNLVVGPFGNLVAPPTAAAAPPYGMSAYGAPAGSGGYPGASTSYGAAPPRPPGGQPPTWGGGGGVPGGYAAPGGYAGGGAPGGQYGGYGAPPPPPTGAPPPPSRRSGWDDAGANGMVPPPPPPGAPPQQLV